MPNELHDPWLTHPPEDSRPSTAKLLVDRLDGIEPLDEQFAANTPKSVPDTLRDHLFGTGTRQDCDDDCHQNTFAVLDASKLPFLPEYLSSSGAKHECLFIGAAADDMRDAAPYLVELGDQDAFTRDLFTASDLPQAMWNNELGVFIRSTTSFDILWAHFRKFIRVPVQNGRWQYVRFWEPAVFGTYFQRVAHRDGVTKLFSPQSLKLTLLYLRASGTCDIARANPAVQDARPHEFVLHTDALTAISAHGQLEAACAAHNLQFNSRDYADIDFKDHSKEDIEIVVLMRAHFGMDARRYDPLGYPANVARQSKQVMLNRLLFFKRQGVTLGL